MSEYSPIIRKLLKKKHNMNVQATHEQAEGHDANHVSRVDFAVAGPSNGDPRSDGKEDAWTVRDPRFSSDVGESSRGGKANETNVSEGGLSDTGTLVSSDEGGSINKHTCSSQEDVVKEIGNLNEKGEIVPFFYVHPVREPKYYPQPLHVFIESMMSQEDYEKSIKAKAAVLVSQENHKESVEAKSKAKSDADEVDQKELILVVCPNEGRDYRFELSRRILGRSPVLKEIFQSGDFLAGSETVITFIEDPAKCFLAVKNYLEAEGHHTAECLRLLATNDGDTKLPITATVGILVGVHKLASKLDLIYLRGMAIDLLHELERKRKVNVFCCMNVASLVFGQGFFKVVIEEFALRQVEKHFDALNGTPAWNDILEKHKESQLSAAWAEMNSSREKLALAVTKMLKGKGKEPEVIPSVSIHGPYNPTFPDPSGAVDATNISDDDEGDIINQYLMPEPARLSGSMEKARELLGGLPTDEPAESSHDTANTAESYTHRGSIDPNCKARKVMGMNSDGGGKIAGRRTQSLVQKATIRAGRAAEKGVKKLMR